MFSNRKTSAQKAAEVARLKAVEGSDPELKEYIPPPSFLDAS